MAQQRRRPTGGRVGDRAGSRSRREPAPANDHRHPPAQDPAAQRVRLKAVVEPVVEAAGYDLETLSLKRVGRRHLVRVLVDSDDGVQLDAVATLSREISAALDAAEETGGEMIVGEYELEVSSPGVDRPLSLPRHWRRNVGRLVKVTAADRPVTGRVTAADETGIELDVDGRIRRLGYPELGPGRVQIEFSRLADLADEDIGEEIDGADEDENLPGAGTFGRRKSETLIDDEEEEGDDEE
jgi:ribosome maturation factor RimP